ncbi:MFS transporter [Paracraurococcus lichenis]|uniref:MFS transporter n=1 Tax=Paracraurococcus lichenis TaxID=3064888 RepID=A0ABT9E7C4_9PROT|nr:MFS transporter [Paracraurococcus sp. LOR1-02]MDO9712074.1 MFS transporter [Paracraurococcus sp. LOR1-02]
MAVELHGRTPRIVRTQRIALALLVLSGVVNYIDRATLAVANPLIREELGLSVGDMGLLLSAFLWAYAFSQLPVGALVDRLGPRKMLAAGLGLWSLAQAAGGFVTSFAQFFAARVVLGIGEAPQFPTAARVSRDWFNPRDRGTATGIWNCSSTLGTAISVPLLTFLMLWVGWRWMFIVMGVLGIAVAALAYVVYRNPSEVALTREERAHLTEGDTTGETSHLTLAEWRRLFAYRTTWGMLLGFFGAIYILWIYASWLPAYLQMERHMSIARTGWVAAIPFVFGVLGSLLGGRITDVLARRGMRPIDSRKWPMAISLAGTGVFTALAAWMPSDAVAIGCISVAMFLCYVSTATGWALVSVAAPANCTASLGAMQNFGGYLGGALAPAVTGFIAEASGSFTPALLVGAVLCIVCAVAYATIIRDPIPAAELDPAGVVAPAE